MPPKKAAAKDVAQGPVLPTIDPEVPLPEGVGPVPDPPFTFAIVQVAGGPVGIEGIGEGGDPIVRQVDPCQLLLAKFKTEREALPEDQLVERQIVSTEPEELQSLAGEGQPLAKGLRTKIETESGARARRKANAARKRAIALAAPDSAGAEAEPEAASGVEFTLLLVGYPRTLEEVDEIRAEGLFDLPDAWVAAFLAAETVTEELDPNGQPDDPPIRSRGALETPEVLDKLYELVHDAELGSKLASVTICTVEDCHSSIPLSPEGEEEAVANAAAGEQLLEKVQRATNLEADKRLRFTDWMKVVETRVEIPELRCEAGGPDLQVYSRLADSVELKNHDVPLLLHCLCEQVAATQGGNEQGASKVVEGVEVDMAAKEDARWEELQRLKHFLDGEFEGLLLGDLPGEGFGAGLAKAHSSPQEVEESAPLAGPLDCLGDGSLNLPYLDRVSCRHVGDELPGAISVISEVQKMLTHIELPGIRRKDFPMAPGTPAERSATRNKFYRFMPGYPIVEVERLLLLRGFEQLLEEAQPDRSWSLRDRVFHERIPAALVVQVLLDAICNSCFVNTRYEERHDCMLIALHLPALRGRQMWHSWHGDLLAPKGQNPAPLCAEPSFNDWWQLVSGEAHQKNKDESHHDPRPRSRLFSFDARDMGYCRMLEKVVLPADGSMIFSSSLQRGLRETFPRPAARGRASDGDDEEGSYVPKPRHELRSTRIVNAGLTFGITTDTVWAERAKEHCKARLKREAVVAEAVAAKEAEAGRLQEVVDTKRAQGMDPTDEEVADAEAARAAANAAATEAVVSPLRPTERRLEDLRFGKLWAAFPDGARCAARLHFERQWYADGAEIYDTDVGVPGVLLTYVPTSGLVIQVLSSGGVCQSWPPQARLSAMALQQAGSVASPRPGGVGDIEVARTVTPTGVLTRELLSGRREFYRTDGTRAIRNPTADELEARLKSPGNAPAEVAFLKSLIEAHKDVHGEGALAAGPSPSQKLKAAGIPGHWLVTRPDGKAFGRTAVLPEEGEIDVDATGASPGGLSDSAARLLELLEGTPVDGGMSVEYEVDDVPVSVLVDPHTGQQVSTSADGVMSIEEEEDPEASRMLILPDGTRITCAISDTGHKVVVEHQQLAKITAVMSDSGAGGTRTVMEIRCSDGSEIEIFPQAIGAVTGMLIAGDPANPKSSTNAAVTLRRPDGTVVLSRGTGEIEMCCGVVEDETLDLRTQARTGVYLAQLDGDKMCMVDPEGNEVEVAGDQSVQCKLANAPEEPQSPRCRIPGQPYCRADWQTAELPLPKEAPPPRLLVIYGDGEAEELLTTSDAMEALRARKDVADGEPMAAPMERCRCHTACRTIPVDAPQPSWETAELPPSVASSIGGGVLDRPQRTFTEFRQLIEYPAVSSQEREDFLKAWGNFNKWEAAHRAKHKAYGEGLRSGAATREAYKKGSEGTDKLANAEQIFSQFDHEGTGKIKIDRIPDLVAALGRDASIGKEVARLLANDGSVELVSLREIVQKLKKVEDLAASVAAPAEGGA